MEFLSRFWFERRVRLTCSKFRWSLRWWKEFSLLPPLFWPDHLWALLLLLSLRGSFSSSHLLSGILIKPFCSFPILISFVVKRTHPDRLIPVCTKSSTIAVSRVAPDVPISLNERTSKRHRWSYTPRFCLFNKVSAIVPVFVPCPIPKISIQCSWLWYFPCIYPSQAGFVRQTSRGGWSEGVKH